MKWKLYEPRNQRHPNILLIFQFIVAFSRMASQLMSP
jgi:hypothetical protein